MQHVSTPLTALYIMWSACRHGKGIPFYEQPPQQYRLLTLPLHTTYNRGVHSRYRYNLLIYSTKMTLIIKVSTITSHPRQKNTHRYTHIQGYIYVQNTSAYKTTTAEQIWKYFQICIYIRERSWGIIMCGSSVYTPIRSSYKCHAKWMRTQSTLRRWWCGKTVFFLSLKYYNRIFLHIHHVWLL